ncbi:MAG: hypothetical protein NVSMB46_02390 [Candidatus Saccharimonadales bacterium]
MMNNERLDMNTHRGENEDVEIESRMALIDAYISDHNISTFYAENEIAKSRSMMGRVGLQHVF